MTGACKPQATKFGNIFDVTDTGLTLVLCMKSVSVEHFAELGSDETGWGECRL